MGAKRLLLACLLLAISYPFVVVNSQDPSDVSSALFYANAKGEDFYLVYPGSSPFITVAQVGRQGSILLVESPNRQVIAGLKEGLEANGNAVEVVSSTGTDMNLELAGRSGSRSFILSDPVYGYNVVSAVAYAKHTGSYLIFANKSSISEVSSFLGQNRPDSILLYGTLDDEVPVAINGLGLTAETINNGDKYEDNIAMLDKYFALRPEIRDVLFTDGSVLEESINEGDFPAVLVSDVIPGSTYGYLFSEVSSGQIVVGTLIGNAHLDAVYDMMKRINSNFEEKKLNVFVKFGQATGAGGEPGPLSMFPLPSPHADVSLDEASYNPALGAFELVYTNKGNAPAYVKSSIAVLLDGNQIGTIGDEQSYVIKRGEKKGMRYPFPNPGEGQLSINDTTYYGLSRYSFDKGFIKYMDVGRISFVDRSSLSLPDASYSPLEDRLTVRVRNNGTEDAFYRLSVSYVNDEGFTFYEEEQVRNISAGRTEIIALSGVIQLPMEKADKTAMNVTATYGAREAFLEKEASAPVKIEGFPWWILLLLLLLLLILFWYYRKKKKEKEAAAEEAPKKKK
ncbi:MAG: hypothetical protein AB1657_00025 [Candidatus Micrarchaeota archaeon]